MYAEGARVREVPLARPVCELIRRVRAFIWPARCYEPTKVYRQLPFCAVPGFVPLCMDPKDPENVRCAFMQRLMRDVPPVEDSRLEKLRLFVRNFCEVHLRPVVPLEFEEWLAGTSYNEARKNELRLVWENLRYRRPTLRQAGHVDTFVKRESYPCFKHARMINSRHDCFKAWSGPIFKAIEEEVYQLPQFIKHIPVPDRPALIAALFKPGCHYYQTDFTAYESHFVAKVMDAIECELYRYCLRNYPDDAEFVCRVLKGTNRMRTRLGIRAEVQARRMSGDMCTSLGNGFTNLMLAMFIVSEKNGELDGFVEGDDGIFRSTVPLTAADYANLGFTIKIEEVTHPCLASFCGVICAESGEIIRDPARFLCNFGWTLSFLGGQTPLMMSLLRAKALSACYETPQCPIAGALARYALTKTRTVLPRWVDDGFHTRPPDEFQVPIFAPSPDTRLVFEKCFGVSIEDQLKVEADIMSGDMSRVSKYIKPHSDVSFFESRYIVAT